MPLANEVFELPDPETSILPEKGYVIMQDAARDVRLMARITVLAEIFNTEVLKRNTPIAVTVFPHGRAVDRTGLVSRVDPTERLFYVTVDEDGDSDETYVALADYVSGKVKVRVLQ